MSYIYRCVSVCYDINCVKYKMQTFSTNLLARNFSLNEISADYLANRPKICGNYPFDKDFLTRNLGEKNFILRCDST